MDLSIQCKHILAVSHTLLMKACAKFVTDLELVGAFRRVRYCLQLVCHDLA